MNAILATLQDRVTVYRYRWINGVSTQLCIYNNIPCGLSRSANTHSPTPVAEAAPAPCITYRLTLFLLPDIDIHLGDRLEISQQGRMFYGVASDSFAYPTHTVCVVSIGESEDIV